MWVHVVRTRVKKLYRCQVLLVKESRDAPAKEVRFFASSDLQADVQTLVNIRNRDERRTAPSPIS